MLTIVINRTDVFTRTTAAFLCSNLTREVRHPFCTHRAIGVIAGDQSWKAELCYYIPLWLTATYNYRTSKLNFFQGSEALALVSLEEWENLHFFLLLVWVGASLFCLEVSREQGIESRDSESQLHLLLLPICFICFKIPRKAFPFILFPNLFIRSLGGLP